MKIPKNIWRWVPGILISIAALIVLVKFINFDELAEAFGRYTLFNIAFIVILIIIPLFFRALAWKSLLQNISFRDSFLIINEGYLLNNLIPRSGEFARIFLVKGVSKINAFQAAASIIIERGLDVIIAAGLFLTTLPLVVELGWLSSAAISLMVLFCCVILGIVLISANAKRIEIWLEKQDIKIRIFKKSIKPILIKGIHGLSSLAKPKNLLLGIFWIISSWFLWVGLFFYILRFIDPDAPFWWAMFAEGLLALGIALPSAPASLGVYEGTAVLALSFFGIEKNTAFSTAIILHSLQILITSLIGVIGFSVHGLKMQEIVRIISDRLKKKNEETGS